MTPMLFTTPVVPGNKTSITTKTSISATPNSVTVRNQEEMLEIVSEMEAIIISPMGQRELN